MIRVSTTTLEQYRRVIETEYASEGELAASIRGEPFTRTWQMAAGAAWDELLADPDVNTDGCFPCTDKDRKRLLEQWRALMENDGEAAAAVGALTGAHLLEEDVEWFRSGAYLFSGNAIALGRKVMGPGTWQVKDTRTLHLGGRPVQLVAKADLAHGLMLADCKARFGTASTKDHEDDLQWRGYLFVHQQAAAFRYCQFTFTDPDDDGEMSLRNTLTCRYWPYPGLEAELRQWLGRFLDWCDTRGLTKYLHREGTGAVEGAAA